MATALTSPRPRSIQAKYVLWTVFALMSALVIVTREWSLLDSHSSLRQRYAPIPWLMLAHGIPGALALVIGAFQFSTRLRQRHLEVHRVMGRIYGLCALISAPAAVVVSLRLPIPTLFMASLIQALGWLIATGTAVYCARTGRVQQHLEWMIRGYAFAAVFVVVRVLILIPAIERAGLMGVATVVWSVIAVAGILPSFIFSWQALAASRRAVKPSPAPAAS